MAFLDQQAVNPFFDLKRLNKEAPLIGYGSGEQTKAPRSAKLLVLALRA